MSGLREKNKALRREAILDAALELLRFNPLQNVTIEQIATRAEVSAPTVYNLIGTREQLLVALVDRVVEDLIELMEGPVTGAEADPIESALAAVDRSVSVFVADSQAFRPIVRALGELAVSGSRLAFDPSQFHVRAMSIAQDRGLLQAAFDPIALGRQSYLSYVAALSAWAAGGLSDRGFGIAARHGLLTVVAAASSDGHRRGYAERLAAQSTRFARVNWNRAEN